MNPKFVKLGKGRKMNFESMNKNLLWKAIQIAKESVYFKDMEYDLLDNFQKFLEQEYQCFGFGEKKK